MTYMHRVAAVHVPASAFGDRRSDAYARQHVSIAQRPTTHATGRA
jgi:hypothetical protein